MPFRALGLDPRILRAIQESGYTEPTPIQIAAIPPILAGHDLIGIAQTGTGKTAAFTLPILTRLAGQARDPRAASSAVPPTASSPEGIPRGARPASTSGGHNHNHHRQPSHGHSHAESSAAMEHRATGPGSAPGVRGTQTLILAPTRELAVQIQDNVRAYGKHLPFPVAAVFGGVGERPQIDALRSGATIVVACPGRLLDLMGRRFADFSNLQHLVLDEADRMLDMGFLPSIRQIIRALPGKRQTLLFSATLSKEIESLTRDFQRHPKLVQIGRRSNPADTVTQWVYEVPKALKPALLVHLLNDPEMNMVLVFSRMKHGADRIARQLEQKGVRTATLHSNRSQNQRLRALQDFKSGRVRVLVATDIAARGIDVDGISHVVNYDFPPHPEDYVHRIGRTGRAHAIGDAISFVSPEETGALRSLERFIGRGIVRRRAEGFSYSAALSGDERGPASPSRPGHPRPLTTPPEHRHRHDPYSVTGRRPAPSSESHSRQHPRHPRRSGRSHRPGSDRHGSDSPGRR